MAKYNTFVVQKTNNGRTVLVTSSARKARQMLTVGHRVEVWSENRKTETVHTRTASKLTPYINIEREYIGKKQAAAERRNKARRARRGDQTRPTT